MSTSPGSTSAAILAESLGPPAAVDTDPDELELPDEVEPDPNPDDPDDPDDPKPDDPNPDEPEDPTPEPDVPEDPKPEDDPDPEEDPDPEDDPDPVEPDEPDVDEPAAGALAVASACDEPEVSWPTTTPIPATANTPTVAAAIRPGLRRRRWSTAVAQVPATGPSPLTDEPGGTQAAGSGGRFDSCSMVQPP